MSEQEVQDAQRSTTAQKRSVFEVTYRPIHNHYKTQFYLDWGTGRYGPWAVVGLNHLEYHIGHRDAVPQRVAKEGAVSPLTAV